MTTTPAAAAVLAKAIEDVVRVLDCRAKKLADGGFLARGEAYQYAANELRRLSVQRVAAPPGCVCNDPTTLSSRMAHASGYCVPAGGCNHDIVTIATQAYGAGQEEGRADGLRDASEMVRERALKIVEAMREGPSAPGHEALRYCRDVLAALGVAIGRKAESMDGDPSCRCGHPRSEHVNGFDRVADCGRELEAGFCACAGFSPPQHNPQGGDVMARLTSEQVRANVDAYERLRDERTERGLCRNCGEPVVMYIGGPLPAQCWVSGYTYSCSADLGDVDSSREGT